MSAFVLSLSCHSCRPFLCQAPFSIAATVRIKIGVLSLFPAFFSTLHPTRTARLCPTHAYDTHTFPIYLLYVHVHRGGWLELRFSRLVHATCGPFRGVCRQAIYRYTVEDLSAFVCAYRGCSAMEGSRIPGFPGLKLCNFGVLLVSAHCFHKADSAEEITAHVSALAREARSPAACPCVWYTPSECIAVVTRMAAHGTGYHRTHTYEMGRMSNL